MITLIQRVKSAHVKVEKEIIGEIQRGLLVYVGFEDGDNLNLDKIKSAASKITHLRCFQDENDKMNKSLIEVNGEILIISNFTLPCDLTESGRRPSFTKSAKPEIAEKLYVKFIEECKSQNIKTKCGKFGAMMDVSSICDGPVNFILKN